MNTNEASEPQQLTNDGSTPFMHNQSIRFAFPERPLEQDYSHGPPLRTCTMTSFGSDSHIKISTWDYNWADLPFFIASILSIVSTFLTVRSIAISGYLIDHSSWDGTGHHYDQHPVVFLNAFETTLVSFSLICGLLTCLSLVLRVLLYTVPLSSHLPVFAFINASCLLSTFILFYERTLSLVGTSFDHVYSRGFYSCLASGVLMWISFCGFFWDWILDSPDTGPLTIILKIMILPSVMYCCTLILGTLSFMKLEHWEYSQAMMFCATALTTIGYGDVVPTTKAGRIFFLIYATVGIGVVGYFLLSLRAVIINGSSANVIVKVNLMRVESLHQLVRSQRQRHRQRSCNRSQLYQQKDPFGNTSCMEYTSPAEETEDAPNRKRVGDPTCVKQQQLVQQQSIGGLSTFSNYTLANILNDDVHQKWVHIVNYSGSWRMAILFTLSWFGGAAIFCALEEDWTYLDALYFSFATQLTIGFGDLVPQTAAAQEFWFIYIIISIALAAYFITMLGDVLAQKLLIDSEMDDAMDSDDRFKHDRLYSSDDFRNNNTLSVSKPQQDPQCLESTSSLPLQQHHDNLPIDQQQRLYGYGSIQPQDGTCVKKNKHSLAYLPLAVTGAHC